MLKSKAAVKAYVVPAEDHVGSSPANKSVALDKESPDYEELCLHAIRELDREEGSNYIQVRKHILDTRNIQIPKQIVQLTLDSLAVSGQLSQNESSGKSYYKLIAGSSLSGQLEPGPASATSARRRSRSPRIQSDATANEECSPPSSAKRPRRGTRVRDKTDNSTGHPSAAQATPLRSQSSNSGHSNMPSTERAIEYKEGQISTVEKVNAPKTISNNEQLEIKTVPIICVESTKAMSNRTPVKEEASKEIQKKESRRSRSQTDSNAKLGDLKEAELQNVNSVPKIHISFDGDHSSSDEIDVSKALTAVSTRTTSSKLPADKALVNIDTKDRLETNDNVIEHKKVVQDIPITDPTCPVCFRY